MNEAYSRIAGCYNTKNVDVWVISYPKSGRTWHRLLVGTYIALKHRSDLSRAADPARLCRAHRLPVIHYTHNGADFMNYLDADDSRVADPTFWRGKKVIFLTRDIRDTLTSAYFHALWRSNRFGGSLADFIRDRTTGAEKLLTALNRWHCNRELASNHLHIRYEDMHVDAASVLRGTLEFCGFQELDETIIRRAAKFCEADNMRKLEQKRFFRSSRLRLASEGEARGAKVRNAKIGDYINHMTDKDIVFIHRIQEQIGNPFNKFGDPVK
jgi:hypothetical protein